MISAILSRVIILGFGFLYPAYCSYKAIRTKNVKEYVRWMMHWVVFSCFVALETFGDVFLSWFPFYYETKLIIVFWLLSPMTKGSSILYKRFVHPKLSKHEQEIDDYINQAKQKGYRTVIDVGTKTFDYASKLLVETAIKATTSVVTVTKHTARDVIDGGIVEERRQMTVVQEMRQNTPTPIQIDDEDDIFVEGSIGQANFEFSDYELELEEPRIRTRSHSRTKDTSVPPAEPKPKVTRAKKVTKAVEQKPARRRRIHVEENFSDDD